MASKALFANNAQSTLGSPVISTDTTITLATGGGSAFPAITTAGNYFNATLTDFSSQTIREIVQVTITSGDVFTVVRGTQGTAPANWAVGDIVFQLCTAGDLSNFVQPAQLQLQAGNYAQDTGSVNAIVISLPVSFDSLNAIIGAPIRVKVASINTGSTTVNLQNFGPISLLYGDGQQLDPGTIFAGTIYEIYYNGSNFTLASGQDAPVSLLKTQLATETTNRTTADSTLQSEINLCALMSAFSFNNNANGTLQISGASTGAIKPYIQWGTGNSVTGHLDSVYFPTPFPNACLCVFACEGGVGGWGSIGSCAPTTVGVQPVDQNSFQISTARFVGGTIVFQGSITYKYFAIGY